MISPFPLGLDSPGPRLTSNAQNRSASRLLAMAGEHLYRGHARYAPHDVTGDGKPETFCNVFAQDMAEAMGVLLPRNMRANELRAWLLGAGVKNSWALGTLWERSDAHAGMAMAEQGCFAVASWANPTGGPGHIAVLMPSLGEAGVWAAQAGAVCFVRELLQRGFGQIAPDIFCHP